MITLWVLSIGLAGCGGGDGDSAPVSPATSDPGQSSNAQSAAGSVPDACALLATADVNAAMGGDTTTQGQVADDGAFSTCSWQDTATGGFVTLNIWGNSTGSAGWTDAFLAAQVASRETEPLSGIGDQTYLTEDDNSVAVYWRKGNRSVVVMTATGTSMSRETFLDLARTADSSL